MEVENCHGNIISWQFLPGEYRKNKSLAKLNRFTALGCPFIWLMFRFEPRHDKTNEMTVRPVKTQISLGILPVWSESSLCAQWEAKDPSFLHADSEDSDQTGRMPRLIWVFAGGTCHFVGFVMRWLICDLLLCLIRDVVTQSRVSHFGHIKPSQEI